MLCIKHTWVASIFRTWCVTAKPSKRERERRDMQVATLVVAAPIGGRGPSANFENARYGEYAISVRHSLPEAY